MKIKKQTVGKRIFFSNAVMILVTVILVVLINVGVINIYWESIEHKWQASIETMADTEEIKDVLEEWIVHQQSFYVLLLADLLVCAGVWMLVSLLFTGNLVRQITKPLNALGQGAKRIRENNLTEKICYQGDAEFEEICDTFNDMQVHLLREEEKNRKYETARTEMIAGISHDLRTPLTAVRGSIKGVLDGVIKEEKQQKRFLETAYRRTGDMDVLLNQLFYLSKLETGNMPLYLQETDLHTWISRYVEGKQQLAGENTVELSQDLDETSGMARIDQEQFQRIFDNLLENSKKYADVQPVRVKITLRESKEGFVIRIADNGRGVPEDKIAHVFDEFYRVDESRNKKEGNGLGLYIVKSLIESMGGTVQAENSPGFTVIMELPKGE